MEVLSLLGLVWILFYIYKWYFKPLKTYEHVTSRGFFLSIIGRKEKERDTYLWALNALKLTATEKRDICYVLGMWFIKNGDCSTAITFFDKSFENFQENFLYKKEFEQVLDSYLECNEREKAKNLLNFFLAHKSFDKKFSKLENKYHFLL